MNDEEALKKIKELAAQGKIKWSKQGEEYFARAGVIKPPGEADFSIVKVEVSFWGENSHDMGGMHINWQTVSAGWGSLGIFIDKDGKLCADTEAMGKEFCKRVLAKLVEDMEIVGRQLPAA